MFQSGRRPSLNSGLIFGKRFEEATGDFLNDDESRQINLVTRGRSRSRLPFHSGLIPGKRNPQLQQLYEDVKRSRPAFHSGFLMGKRLPVSAEADEFDLEEFKRRAQRLHFSDGMMFGK